MDNIYKEVNGEIIKGRSLFIFVRNGNRYHFETIGIYQNGVIQAWATQWTLKEFEENVNKGTFVTSLPEGAEVSILSQGSYGPKSEGRSYD